MRREDAVGAEFHDRAVAPKLLRAAHIVSYGTTKILTLYCSVRQLTAARTAWSSAAEAEGRASMSATRT